MPVCKAHALKSSQLKTGTLSRQYQTMKFLVTKNNMAVLLIIKRYYLKT
jgi:hypothetical protein